MVALKLSVPISFVRWSVAGDLTNGVAAATSYFTAAAAGTGGGLSAAAEAPWTPAIHLPVDASTVGLTSLGFDPSAAAAAAAAAAGTALFQHPTHQTPPQLVAQQFAAFRVSSRV